jgi:hypothetical protein
VLARAAYTCAAVSPHIVDIELVRRGLHIEPANLQSHLQSIIDACENKPYDAILLTYGLCGKATEGLISRSKPLVIPRAHDCITIFLGSRERYDEQFSKNPGTYWYAQDYIERDDGTGTTLSLGSASDLTTQEKYQEYVEKYGKDNADYLMEVMGAWQTHYQRAVYIDMGIGDGSAVKEKAFNEASRRGWSFESLSGDIGIIRKLIDGNWDNDLLVVSPGEKIIMTYNQAIISNVPNK